MAAVSICCRWSAISELLFSGDRRVQVLNGCRWTAISELLFSTDP